MPTFSQRIAKLTSEVNAIREAALPNGTVEMFIEVLSSKLTQWDKRYNKSNPYALGHFMGAVGRVRDMMQSDLKKDDPATLAKLKKVIDRFLDPQFGPVKTTKKQIDQFLEKGTKPSLVRKSFVSTHVAHVKEADDWNEMLHRMMTREPGPEEIALNKDIAVYDAVWRGIEHVYYDIMGQGNLKTFGNFRKTPKKPGDKERGVSDVLRKNDWANMRSEGIRSPRDLPKDVPVQIFIDAHYEQGGRVYDRLGYITAGGREVILAQGRMTVFERIREAAKKNLPKLAEKYKRLRDQAEKARDQIPL